MKEQELGGIYQIENIINGKIYVGKAKVFKSRWQKHKSDLKRDIKSKDTNRYLFHSVKKYGLENFLFGILEIVDLSLGDNYLKERELWWMDKLNTCNRKFGYNLRRDSSTNTEVHEDTRALLRETMKGEGNPNFGNFWTEEQKLRMSEIKKEQYRAGEIKIDLENTYKGIIERNRRWEENPDLKKQMIDKVSAIHNKYEYLKIDIESNEILEVFQSRVKIKDKYPDIGKTIILSVCNGSKKSYRGFIWRYRDRQTGEIIEPTPKWNKTLREKASKS